MQGSLIGLTGFIGAGKSEVARILQEHFGFTRVKYADGLKDMLRAMGLSDIHVEGDLKEVPCDLLCGKSPREAMLSLGTEWGRKMIGTDLWVNITKRRVSCLLDEGCSVVVDDVRFLNEATAIRTYGGVVWRVAGRVRVTPNKHESEVGQHLLPVDATIANIGTLCDLATVTYAMLKGLKQP